MKEPTVSQSMKFNTYEAVAQAQTQTETQVQPAPAPTPQVAPPSNTPPSTMSEEKREKPTELPKTASPLDLIGLIGLLSMSGGFVTQFLRC